MKFEIEIEATPAEVRAFLGLPDMTPLHDAWIEQMKTYTTQPASQEDWNKLATNWAASVPGLNGGMQAWQNMMNSAMTPPKNKKD